jgi:hypothetical protein
MAATTTGSSAAVVSADATRSAGAGTDAVSASDGFTSRGRDVVVEHEATTSSSASSDRPTREYVAHEGRSGRRELRTTPANTAIWSGR